MKKMADLVTVR